MKYRREIDGLRALALLPVLLFHAGFPHFRGGFVGVDVFFVISGYLITSIILADLERGQFSLLGFYERRARRILPALFVMLLFCLPFVWLVLLPRDAAEFSRSLVAVSAFSSNILFWRESGYFATAGELKPLLHTWSLSLEEQHYVVFPLLMSVSWRLGRRWVTALLGAAFATSLVLAQWGAAHMPEAAFYLLPTRTWELLLGALIAMGLRTSPQRVLPAAAQEAAGLAGLLLLGLSVAVFDESSRFPGLVALVPTGGAALLIVCATERTLAGRVLGHPLLVKTGLISYSVYLWHQPILAFARHRSVEELGTWVRIALVALSLGVGALSWRYVERPFRDTAKVSRRSLVRLAGAGSLFFIAVGVLQLTFNDAYERRWIALQPERVRTMLRLIDESDNRSNLAAENGWHGDGPCRFNVPRVTPELEEQIIACRNQHGAGVAVIGDSHAIDLFGVVIAGSDEPFIIGVTQLGCRPHSPLPGCPYDEFLSFLAREPGLFDAIMYEQAGFYLMKRDGVDGQREIFSSVPMDEAVVGVVIDDERVALVYDYLAAVSRHAPVLWLGSRLEPHISDKLMLARGCDYPYRLRSGQREAFDRLDARIARVTSGSPRVRFESQNALLRIALPGDLMTCESLYWSDGDHLSAAGERLFGTRVDLVAIARSRGEPR